MAEKAADEADKQQSLYGLYGLCFFRPTMHIHTTALSFSDWVEVHDNTPTIKKEAQREMAWQTLLSAHAVILNVLKIQDDYFNLDLDETIVDDFMDVWGRKPASNATSA